MASIRIVSSITRSASIFRIDCEITSRVSIEVRACGVNYADGIIRMGLYASAKQLHGYPITPGFELSGVITAIGADVYTQGSKTIGSVLVRRMKLAGG